MKIEDIKRQEFIDVISQERLDSYYINPDDDFSVLIERYIYNIIVSESFYPILSILEIALRNKINNAIEHRIKPNWLLSELETQDLLLNNEYKILLDAEKKLKNKRKSKSSEITKGALIAELTFGFWINLCKKAYKTKFWDKKGVFNEVFPCYPATKEMDRIRFIAPELKNILKLRNRIFHHEIIINNHIGIENCYKNIGEILSYISNNAVVLADEFPHFQELLKQKP